MASPQTGSRETLQESTRHRKILELDAGIRYDKYLASYQGEGDLLGKGEKWQLKDGDQDYAGSVAQ